MVLKESAVQSITEGIDHIATLPVFNWDNMLASIPMVELYDALRKKYGKSPLLHTAEKLKEHVKKGDVVVITTGFIVSTMDVIESDGPVGAATLARALSIGLGATPVMIVEESHVESMKPICMAAGLKTYPVEKVKDTPHRIAVTGFPKDVSKAKVRAEEIMRTLNPSALISVECSDHNSKGVYHSAKGIDTSSYQAKFPTLYELAYQSNTFTVGIGDFGNEIGMANLSDAISRLLPSHASCKCGCGGGIVGTTKTHASIIANISNWGAYSLEAAIAVLFRNSEIMHDASTEARVLEETARVGYVDPVIGFVEPSADGASVEITTHLVQLLRSMVRLPESEAFREAFS
ncbi:MAG TPA: glutamate cyclase domain-containing protein [Candidatus Bathyarchaeia archaeon]|nr:glutamate cyclase domain-containing protein [Candidatus Bathyarchaeia archaeon]